MYISELLRKIFFYDKWDIGIYHGALEAFIKTPELNKIKWLNKYNKYSFVADPFIFIEQNRLIILAEHFNYFTCKGKIVSLESDFDFTKVKITDEIITPHHMSYPHVFEYEGNIYCIPETGQANKLMLYKYDISTSKFVFEKNLLENFAATDSTILHHNDKWWLFCTKGPDKANSDLYIWHSDNPLSGWAQHKNNPVKSDKSSTRPAGNFFYMNEKLYRPAQNCSKTYGGSLVINKILKLNEEEFEEKTEFEIFPDKNSPYKDGLHSLSVGKNIIIVDGKKLQFSALNPLFIIIQKMRAAIQKTKSNN